ncbi:MAG: DUF5721 family protein [Lachnospiraceae bacterium]|nr:DUF5721 family protein [Lachnospiraceae bacterium]
MISLQILDVKEFMHQLLKTDLFDHFLVSEVVITNSITYHLDGHLNTSFYSEDELEKLDIKNLPFAPFSLVRNNCFELIKGKRTPTYFKFVFQLSPKNLENTLAKTKSSFSVNDISGVFFNLHFQNRILTATTGVSYRIFSLDHSFENEWDSYICRFLKQHQITYEMLT